MLNGQGTASVPYRIEAAADLAEICRDLSACYSLEADIGLQGEFAPIGSQFEPFRGVFDGNGHRITGLFMRHTTQYAGLFAWNEGTIRNLRLEDADIWGTGAVGGVAGYHNGVIENCTVSGKIRGTSWVGGLAGKLGENARVQGEDLSSASGTKWPEAKGEGVCLFVAPDGSDESPGTKESPLGTLEEARNRVRKLIAAQIGTDITVYLRGGEYSFPQPFRLGWEDCFHNGQTVTYQSFPGETARCIGGRKLTGWEQAGNGMLRCDAGGAKAKRLLVNGSLKRPAAAVNWTDYPGVPLEYLYAYYSHGWFSEDLKVTGIDCAAGQVQTELPPSSFSGQPQYLYGALEYLQNPGDWAWGPDGHLYYLPEENDPLDIWLPETPVIFQIEGESGEKPAENIQLHGLDFRLTDAGKSFTAQGGRGKEGFDEPDNTLAAVFFKHARSCRIVSCQIADCSVNGVAVQGESSRCMIENCRIQRAGYAGIHLSGSWIDRKEYSNFHHYISNNEISEVGLFAVNGAGLYILGSGHNHIYRNLVSHAPRYGISIKGARYGCWPTDCGINQDGSIPFERHWDYLHSRNNLIEGNEVYDVGRNSLDGGGIEAWGPGRDNAADYNLVHNFYNGKPTINWKGHGIFLDDATHYFQVTNNIVYESGTQGADASTFMKSIGIVVRNNIFDVTNTHQGAANISPYNEPCWDQRFVCNIVYADPKGGIGEDGQFVPGGSLDRRMYTYDQTASAGWDQPVLREMDYNLYWNTSGGYLVSTNNTDPSADVPLDDFIREMGVDRHSVVADPLFVDAPNRNYTLKKESPAFQLGFKNIDRAQIGRIR